MLKYLTPDVVCDGMANIVVGSRSYEQIRKGFLTLGTFMFLIFSSLETCSHNFFSFRLSALPILSLCQLLFNYYSRLVSYPICSSLLTFRRFIVPLTLCLEICSHNSFSLVCVANPFSVSFSSITTLDLFLTRVLHVQAVLRTSVSRATKLPEGSAGFPSVAIELRWLVVERLLL